MVDYIINAVKSTAPGAELSEDSDIDIRDGFSGWEWIVLNICEVRYPLPVAFGPLKSISPSAMRSPFKGHHQVTLRPSCMHVPMQDAAQAWRSASNIAVEAAPCK